MMMKGMRNGHRISRLTKISPMKDVTVVGGGVSVSVEESVSVEKSVSVSVVLEEGGEGFNAAEMMEDERRMMNANKTTATNTWQVTEKKVGFT